MGGEAHEEGGEGSGSRDGAEDGGDGEEEGGRVRYVGEEVLPWVAVLLRGTGRDRGPGDEDMEGEASLWGAEGGWTAREVVENQVGRIWTYCDQRAVSGRSGREGATAAAGGADVGGKGAGGVVGGVDVGGGGAGGAAGGADIDDGGAGVALKHMQSCSQRHPLQSFSSVPWGDGEDFCSN